jgi:predicted NAD/FAD-binding protein
MKKMAIVGTGIAGMSAAYFFKDLYDITVYEKNDYIGGHTNTVIVHEKDQDVPIDTGFMVFNEITYPNLLKLFKKLDVQYVDTDMSFSVQHKKSGLEYNGSNFNGLFAQRKNLFNISYIRMLYQIKKFFHQAEIDLDQNQFDNLSIQDYCKQLNLGQDFYYKFLIPMSSAVWSTPPDKMGEYPAKSLIRFFKNHGFLGIDTQFQWKTIQNGSQVYREKIIDSFRTSIKTKAEVTQVKLINDKVEVTSNDESILYDKVIMASHADETLRTLHNPTQLQQELLSKFHYQKNIALLHTDKSVMPATRRAWSAWNYVIDKNEQDSFTVYYMNQLQPLKTQTEYFININGEKHVRPETIIKKIIYHHPVFDVAAVSAQEQLHHLNEIGPIYFCGSYFKYGFHEDALTSSVKLYEQMTGKSPW